MSRRKRDVPADVLLSRAAGRRRRINRDRLASAQAMRKKPSRAEAMLWSQLRRDALGVRFRRQHNIGPYIADFYCHRAKLVVELDGSSHADRVEYDADRDGWMESLGLTVMRFRNADVFGNLPGVVARIRRYVEQATSS